MGRKKLKKQLVIDFSLLNNPFQEIGYPGYSNSGEELLMRTSAEKILICDNNKLNPVAGIDPLSILNAISSPGGGCAVEEAAMLQMDKFRHLFENREPQFFNILSIHLVTNATKRMTCAFCNGSFRATPTRLMRHLKSVQHIGKMKKHNLVFQLEPFAFWMHTLLISQKGSMMKMEVPAPSIQPAVKVVQAPDAKVDPSVTTRSTTDLDKIIRVIYDLEKISDGRKSALKVVTRRVEEAFKNKPWNDFIRNGKFQLEEYGSSCTGFGLNRSDLDISFRYTEDVDRWKTMSEKHSKMHLDTITSIEQALKSAGFEQVESISAAKVPVVKFVTTVDGMEIDGDISCYNELALHNTKLLQRYCTWTKDEMLSKLGVFIKIWSKECDICDASKKLLSSYKYMILLIHFLQRIHPHPLLPFLQEIGEKKQILVEGWDVYFCNESPKPDWSQCTLSVGELFLQFLEYFAKFDWNTQVVQIRQSGVLKKIDLDWNDQMCIQDPFALDRNLGSGIDNPMFNFIIKSFVTSHKVFSHLNEGGAHVQQLGEFSDYTIAKFASSLFAQCRELAGRTVLNMTTSFGTRKSSQFMAKPGVNPFDVLELIPTGSTVRKVCGEAEILHRFKELRGRFDQCDKKEFFKRTSALFNKLNPAACKLCNIRLEVASSLITHLPGKKHLRKVTEVNADALDFWFDVINAETIEAPQFVAKPGVDPLDVLKFSCQQSTFRNVCGEAEMRYLFKELRRRFDQCDKKELSLRTASMFKKCHPPDCYLCNVKVESSARSLINHLTCKKHLGNLSAVNTDALDFWFEAIDELSR